MKLRTLLLITCLLLRKRLRVRLALVLDVKSMVVEVCLLDERIFSLDIMSKGIIRSFESIFGFPNCNSVLTLRGTSEECGSSYAFCSYNII